MHPCCWGNLFQGLAQLVPVLALLLLAGKKVFGGANLFTPRKQLKAVEEKGACCCPHETAADQTSEVEFVKT